MERPERAMVVKAVMEAAIITAVMAEPVLLALKVKMARMPLLYGGGGGAGSGGSGGGGGGSAAGPPGNVNTPGQKVELPAHSGKAWKRQGRLRDHILLIRRITT